jgi:hypothetical protein
VVPSGEISPALLSIVIDEYRRGLDPQRRVVMRRWCDVEHASNVHMGPTTLASDREACAAASLGHEQRGAFHGYDASTAAPDCAAQR